MDSITCIKGKKKKKQQVLIIFAYYVYPSFVTCSKKKKKKKNFCYLLDLSVYGFIFIFINQCPKSIY